MVEPSRDAVQHHLRAKYPYRKLKQSRDIRLLCVEPGTGSDLIACSLGHASLLDSLNYEALSYVWGSNEDLKEVCCDGYLISVTRNLHEALQVCRLPNRSRILWIDALCINQADEIEKTIQVRLMGDIYKHARSGFIWLGNAVESDKLALYLLESLYTLFKCCAGHIDMNKARPDDEDLRFAKEKVTDAVRRDYASPGLWSALNKFYRHAWFSRVWVIQEVVFMPNYTSQPTIVAFGPHTITWNKLAFVTQGIIALGLFDRLQSSHRPNLGHNTVSMMEHMRYTLSKSNFPSLLAILDSTSESRATDPRDKIFALVGLLGVKTTDIPSLNPDYTKSVQQVFTEVAVETLFRFKTLRILQAVSGKLPQYCCNGGVSDLPSWVTDWSRTSSRHLETWNFCAGGEEDPELQVRDSGKILIIQGKIIDRVKNLMEHEKIVQNEINPDVLSDYNAVVRYKTTWYQSCIQTVSTLSKILTTGEFSTRSQLVSYPTGECFQEAFWRTLICNTTIQRKKPTEEYGKHWLALHHIYCQFQKTLDAQKRSQQQVSDVIEFEHAMDTFAGGRRFCVTEKGYMGWVPQRTQFGDIICVLKGGRVPFIIRPAFFKGGTPPFLIRPTATYHELIGECYMHGWMEGQAMRGDCFKLVDIMLR